MPSPAAPGEGPKDHSVDSKIVESVQNSGVVVPVSVVSHLARLTANRATALTVSLVHREPSRRISR